MSTVAITITVMTASVCLVTFGVMLYAVMAENPDVENLGFALSITAIIIGAAAAVVAEALD